MAFKKGNKLAALGDHTKKRVLTQQLISELNEVDADGVSRMRKIIRALVSNAEANDNAAIKEIFNPDDVRMVLEFDKRGDNDLAEHALMHETPVSMVDIRQFTGVKPPTLHGIRYKFTNGEYRR
jgi:hypothetical protein